MGEVGVERDDHVRDVCQRHLVTYPPVRQAEPMCFRGTRVFIRPNYFPLLSLTALRATTYSRCRMSSALPQSLEGPPNPPDKPNQLKFLRTPCGPGGTMRPVTCANVPIHTLKRNSTTSPSDIT